MAVPLHSPTYLHGKRQNVTCGCVFAAPPANCGPFVSLRPVPGGESAGCVCLQLPCSAGCLPTCHFACHAHCPSTSCPHSSLLCPVHPFCFTLLRFPLFHAMCARITTHLHSFVSFFLPVKPSSHPLESHSSLQAFKTAVHHYLIENRVIDFHSMIKVDDSVQSEQCPSAC